jgi:hypothetical protein
MTNDSTIMDEISRLLSVRRKLQEGDYITSRDEENVSMILGIHKFKDAKELETRIDEFFDWAGEMLKRS